MGVTLTDFNRSVRELSFDRFVTPTFFINKTGAFVTITNDAFTLEQNGESQIFSFSSFPFIEDVANSVAGSSFDIPISFGASYIPTDPSNSFLPLNRKSIEFMTAIFRRYFFSDAAIANSVKEFLYKRGLVSYGQSINVAEVIGELKEPQDKYLAMMVAYQLLDIRRLHELAANALGQSTFSLSGDAQIFSSVGDDYSMNVSIGSVFNLSNSPQDSSELKESAKVGADNVLGDLSSFWYKLQLWLRDKIEQCFGDFSLRKDQAIPGKIQLEKDLNWYAYFDNYPYTISPYTRGILQNSDSNSIYS